MRVGAIAGQLRRSPARGNENHGGLEDANRLFAARRRRGRPPLIVDEQGSLPVPLPPLTAIARQRFDDSELEAAIAHAEQVTRQTSARSTHWSTATAEQLGHKAKPGAVANRTASVITLPGMGAMLATGRTANRWTGVLRLAFS